MNSFALVDAWEDGSRLSRIERPLALLAASEPGSKLEDWARLPVGRRDARLFRLREELFGPQLNAAASCPNCGENLDIPMSVSDILVPTPETEDFQTLAVQNGRFSVQFRLPTTEDLLAVAEMAELEDPRKLLLERCILEVNQDGAITRADTLPEDVAEAVAKEMGEADPQAIVNLALNCPGCGNGWSIPFDICTFLWLEVEDLVKRIFREVHLLALSYGWSERDILGMSPFRRRFYLDMVEG